jgi:creatinine amidohydrolase
MNGHDGNIAPIEIASRAIKMQYPEVKIASLDAWWVAAGNLLPADTFEVWNGLGHAGEGETSIGLSLFPELVEMEYARGVVPDHLPAHIEIKWNFAEITDCGATGDPTKATAEKGRKMEEVLIKVVADFLNDMNTKGWAYHSSVSSLK